MIVLVPTRGRPENIKALREAVDATAVGNPRFIFAVDVDDPKADAYVGLGEEFIIGGPARLGPWLNELALRYAPEDSIIGFMGDDHRPRTHAWDQKIELALTTPGIAYGNDLIQGPNLPTAAFISRQIIYELGYMVPPGLVHLYIDNAWKSLGEGIGRLRYLPEVVIEHCHPIANKGVEWDDGYKLNNGGDVMEADAKVFAEWVQNDLVPASARLRSLL